MKTTTLRQNNRRRLPAAHDHAACAPCAGCGRTLPRRHVGKTLCATCRKQMAGRPVTRASQPAQSVLDAERRARIARARIASGEARKATVAG